MAQKSTRIGWWLYFAYCAGVYIWGMLALAVSGIFPAISLATSVLDLACLFALYCYIQGIPFLARMIWRVAAALLMFRLAFVVYVSLPGVFPWHGLPEQRVSLLLLWGVITGLPMLYVLVQYSFLRKDIWVSVQQ